MSICEKCEYYDTSDEEEEWCNNSGELLGDTCDKEECDDFQEREND